MSARRLVIRIVSLTLLFALGTWLFGWWSVPILAAIYALVDRRGRARGTIAAASAVLSWCAILAWYAVRGGAVAEATARMSALLKIPPAAFVAVTMAFVALLAGTAAAAVAGFTQRSSIARR